MTRLLIHVEGQTEETFVNDLLADHLHNYGYEIVSARIIGNARLRERRGGIRAWSTVKKDILNHLKEDTDCLATTMVDYYGLPQKGDGAWPGRAEAEKLPYAEKSPRVEGALFADVAKELGGEFEARRFIPFVVMHEYEGLLFSDCEAFAEAIARPQLGQRFRDIRQQFATPEEIDDSPITAPSKRVEALVAGYEKPLLGTLAALKMGLDKIRGECPHFKAWLEQLEAWPNQHGA